MREFIKDKEEFRLAIKKLDEDISEGYTDFAIMMMDINFLKKINNKYGYNRGDSYIDGCCDVAKKIFKNSDVYRVGGDEFAFVIKGNEYKGRDMLFSLLQIEFENIANDTSLRPWDRYSAAIGISGYKQGDNADSIYRRADENMYRNKEIMEGKIDIFAF